MSTPVLMLSERYEPRVCASANCPEPPVVTYVVAINGAVFGREWRAGQSFHVCAIHDLTPSYTHGTFNVRQGG